MSVLDELDEMARRTALWKSVACCAYCLRRDYEWNGWFDVLRQADAHPDNVAYLVGPGAFPEPSYLCPSCRAPVQAWWAALHSPPRAA